MATATVEQNPLPSIVPKGQEPEPTHLALATPTPGELLRIAVSQGADMDKLERLIALQERWLAAEAKRAFDDAKTKFGAFAVQVAKDKDNSQYESRYTSLGNLVNTVTPFLAKCDLNADWEIDQSSGIKVTCILAHRLGHSKRVSLTVPPDTSGAKNTLQQIKSSITYAKVCTFESVCGLASTDANVDDDGNGSKGGGNRIAPERIREHRDRLATAKTVIELQDFFKAAYSEASAANDAAAQKVYINAKDARKKELR